MSNMSLGERMKRYEVVPKNFLMKRQPCIIRLDGKSFHSYTRGFDKPFDKDLMEVMQSTMRYLCKEIQGCVLGYTQSDEITLVLCDYQKLDTDGWFDYNVQKITSISASMATFKFNQLMAERLIYRIEQGEKDIKFLDKIEKGALFDSRCFTVPIEEVNNCLLWRQQDATRNSIQALAQSLYSHKELLGINTKALQDKMFTEKGINWNDLSTDKKRGSCAVKKDGTWVIDLEIPIFSQDTNYVNSRITFKEEE